MKTLEVISERLESGICKKLFIYSGIQIMVVRGDSRHSFEDLEQYAIEQLKEKYKGKYNIRFNNIDVDTSMWKNNGYPLFHPDSYSSKILKELEQDEIVKTCEIIWKYGDIF